MFFFTCVVFIPYKSNACPLKTKDKEIARSAHPKKSIVKML